MQLQKFQCDLAATAHPCTFTIFVELKRQSMCIIQIGECTCVQKLNLFVPRFIILSRVQCAVAATRTKKRNFKRKLN